MSQKIKVLYVTAEISAYASVGGLGEVSESFPRAMLETKDIEIRRVMPLYKDTDGKKKYLKDFAVPMGKSFETCVLKTDPDNKEIPTYFVGNDRYFHRDSIYSQADDGFRFYFFCRSVIEMLKNITFKPDIIHVNDWHTGFLPLLIKKEFPNIKTVFTIHNASYHGFIPDHIMNEDLLLEDMVKLGWPEWLDFLKAGVLYADKLTTVSKSYTEELMQSSLNYGLEGLLSLRGDLVTGIANGIDMDEYNPLDKILPFPYDKTSMSEKKKNRTFLRNEYGLADKDIPLIAMVSRLDAQKGIELLLSVIHQMDLTSFQMIIVGSGNDYYQDMLMSLSELYPESIVYDEKYSSSLAKLVYAASDIYLMPSKQEPCGLGQLYAMRYGSVPVVNPVGGLKDTVIEDPEYIEKSCGFTMEDWNQTALKEALERAIMAYQEENWTVIMKNCMKRDSSWKKSIAEYKKLYNDILADKNN